jgi:hypothetical protein
VDFINNYQVREFQDGALLFAGEVKHFSYSGH